MRLITGVSLLDMQVHADARGELVALDASENVPFFPRRVFFIRVSDAGVIRGGHANSCDEFIVAVSGGATVKLDNGRERCSVRLLPGDRGLWIKPGILIDLLGFEPGTTLLVCASASFQDTRHFHVPQPELYLAEAV